MSPADESAISRAIKTAEERAGDAIFHPYEGTRFNTFEEAREFYNLYSWEVGFGIRTSRGRTNNNDYTTRKDVCCSCEVGGVLFSVRYAGYENGDGLPYSCSYFGRRVGVGTRRRLRAGRVAGQ